MNICPKCKEPIVVPEGKDFVICSCGEVIIIMTNQDMGILINELENPSEPNEALKNGVSRYKKLK
jgi:uncharacterized protein (DUF1778 family)